MLSEEDKQTLEYFRGKLPIDQFSLEKENSQQPVLFDEVGEWVAGIKANAKTAKEHVEFVKADLFSRVRSNPEDFGLTGKITNDSIGSIVVTHPDYCKAIEDYIEANRLSDEASTLLSSVEQRKSLIGNLVQLFIRAYYHSDKPVDDSSWRDDEQAIIALRNQKAAKQDNLEESEI